VKFFERLRFRRELRTFDALADDTPEGTRVHISGTIRALGAPLLSPIDARPCVAYTARARGYTTSGGTLTSTDWRETVELTRFAIERDVGTPVLVDGNHAVLAVARHIRSRRQPERETEFLARHAIHLGGARFEETFVEAGRRVTVGGTLVLVPQVTPERAERGFRDGAPMQALLSGTRGQPLVIVT
jgi:hypothetical protein